jgi:hypothetical protein
MSQILTTPLGVRYLTWFDTSSSVEPIPTPSVFFDEVP